VKVGIVGQGYVGSALGKAAHSVGHEVIGIEIDQNRLTTLENEVEYRITSNFTELSTCKIVVIAVPTPLDERGNPDISYIKDACTSLSQVLTERTLVINESTSFPGTLRKTIAPTLGPKNLYASAPERIDPANSKWNIFNTPRVIAGLNNQALLEAFNFYKSFCDSVIKVSTPEVAETAKLFENTFRQVNIALVNELSVITSSLEIPTNEVILAASSKPFGFMPFSPSLGVGGHCIPVDPIYLSYAAAERGINAQFINLATRVNSEMPKVIVDKVEKLLGKKLRGLEVQVAGIAYKSGVSDLRESPALKLIDLLRNLGAKVTWHDNYVEEWNGEISQPLQEVEVGLIATNHPKVDYSTWKHGRTTVFDLSANLHSDWNRVL